MDRYHVEWISREKSAPSVDKMPVDSMLWSRCRLQLTEIAVFEAEKVRRPVINGDGHTGENGGGERTAWIRYRRSSAYNEMKDPGQRRC